MGLFSRKPKTGVTRGADSADTQHLSEWAKERRGVEGFVEPETHDQAPTLVLVAHDGEWTRRRIGGPKAAFDLGKKLGIPVYDVAALGYPQRMRDWTAAQKKKQKGS
jgi:hypothetical protein